VAICTSPRIVTPDDYSPGRAESKFVATGDFNTGLLFVPILFEMSLSVTYSVEASEIRESISVTFWRFLGANGSLCFAFIVTGRPFINHWLLARGPECGSCLVG
jgi:hypothetical protein